MTLVLLIVLAGLIILSGTLSSPETALFSLSSIKVHAYRYRKDPRGQLIAKLLANPRKLLVTILMLNVGMNILVQNVVSGLFGAFSSWALTAAIAGFLMQKGFQNRDLTRLYIGNMFSMNFKD